MSELDDVIGGEIIAAAFTNQVKNRTAMRYQDAATRDTSIPAPIAGDIAFLVVSATTGAGEITYYTGSQWLTVADNERVEQRYVQLVGGPQTINGDLSIAGELAVIENNQAFLPPLVRNVIIDNGTPAVAVKGSLWIDQVANTLYFSDGVAWQVAIQGV